MALSMHHALYDAEGLRYILKDLAATLYNAAHTNRAEIGIDSLLSSALSWTEEQARSAEAYWTETLRHV
ncbi:hypothetical protein LTR53_019164, partial [Teratosphaeriaceae sp. CCFEE 6253]